MGTTTSTVGGRERLAQVVPDAIAAIHEVLRRHNVTEQEWHAVLRFLTDVGEQDDLNRVWAEYLGGHLPTTTTVEVSRLATHPRCKLEITAIAVADE